ncbi:hypothetical protein EDB85DRAFT_2292392 [Lactarius pseudohatsudake]|nr:hypothetical protein EDB85DRAFT_2292392 [Lactarius pseudohatsudake]
MGTQWLKISYEASVLLVPPVVSKRRRDRHDARCRQRHKPRAQRRGRAVCSRGPTTHPSVIDGVEHGATRRTFARCPLASFLSSCIGTGELRRAVLELRLVLVRPLLPSGHAPLRLRELRACRARDARLLLIAAALQGHVFALEHLGALAHAPELLQLWLVRLGLRDERGELLELLVGAPEVLSMVLLEYERVVLRSQPRERFHCRGAKLTCAGTGLFICI